MPCSARKGDPFTSYEQAPQNVRYPHLQSSLECKHLICSLAVTRSCVHHTSLDVIEQRSYMVG
jgi:hypothetical protein